MPLDLPTIPAWVQPLDTGQPSTADLNDLGTLPKANFAAGNTVIPLTYGRDRLFGQPFVVHVDETLGNLFVGYSFCEGEIAGFESVLVDSADAFATGTAYEGLKNRSFETGDKYGWDLESAQDGTVSAVESRTGDYSVRVNSLAGGPNQFSNRLKAPPVDTVVTVRGYVMRDPLALPDANARIYIRDATTVGGALSVTSGITGIATADEAVVGWQSIEFQYTVPTGVVEYVFELGESAGTTGGWYFDDCSAVILDPTDATKEISIEVVPYVGSASQRFDSMFNIALTGYMDDVPGLAYLAVRAAAGTSRGFPRVEAIIQGRKVYDPRLDSTRTDITPNGSGSHLAGDPTTWEFTQNPTICFLDLITNYTGWDMFDQGVVDNADLNDELVTGIPRRQFGLSMARTNTVETWVKGFRTYMGAFLGWEGGKVRLVPNRPTVEAPGAIVLDESAGTWVDMGDQAELDVGTADFTLEAAFNITDAASDQIIAGKKSNSSLLAGYWIQVNNTTGYLSARIGDGTNEAVVLNNTANFEDSEWHTVALVVDQTGNTMHLVVDDVAGSTVSISGVTGTLDNAQPFRIGAKGGGGGRVSGKVDEVRLWNDIRTPAELTANRLSEIPTPAADASLVGYWKLNEGTSATTAVDSSASANDGTLAGAAVFGFGNPQIIPDGVAMHIGVDDIVKDTLKLKRRSFRSVPNSVAVDYVDSSGTRWFTSRVQSDSPRVTSGAESRRLSRVSLPGIHNASQAQREATERLNWYLTDLECTVSLFDEGWQLQHGSIVAVTHPIGLDAKLFRVRQSAAKSGRWTVGLVEYDPAVYSDSVISDPTIPDTNLGDPLNPPSVDNLVLDEELFRYRTGTTGSRVRITWDATGFPFLSQYLVEGYVAGAKVWQTTTAANDIVTPGVEEIVDTIGTATDYEVRVYVQSPFASGPATIDTLTILGKFALPGDVPGITATQVGSDQVAVSWEDAVDIDIWRYELKVGVPSEDSLEVQWAAATRTDLMDDTDRVFTGLALGSYRYLVKAIDSVKQESVTAAFTDVTLTAPLAVAGLFGFEVASEVRLNWLAAGGYVERYRIAYSDIPQTFETTLDVVDTLRFQTKDVPEGTFTFKCYSQDSAGNESTTAATIDIEVTSDADAFLADTYNFTQSTSEHANGSLTNMVEWDLRLDDLNYYVTNMAEAFAVTPTDFIAATPLANYHSTGASEWLSETKDFGLPLTGSWNLTHDTTALQGTVDIALELSNDDVTYISFGGSAKGQFQYARVRITTAATPGTATGFVKSPIMSLRVNVVPLEESGESTSSATAGEGATVNLSREYTALKEIVAQPKNTIATGSAVTAIVDTIIVGPNTGLQCDGTNYLVGGDWATLDFGTGDFTIEYWTQHDGSAVSNQIMMGKRNGILEGWSVLHDYDLFEVDFVIDDGTTQVSCVTTGDALPNDGDKHHVAIVVDGGVNVNIYIDSVLAGGSPYDISTVGSVSSSVNFNGFASNTATGIHASGGLLDEVRIWNTTKTQPQILASYQIELDMSQTQTGLVGYWRVNGDVGDTLVAAETTPDGVAASTNDLTSTGAGALTFVDMGPSSPVQKINSFDVFIFDTFGQQLAEQFQWKWKAV